MGRKSKPLNEIVKTAGISLTDAEQERAEQLAALWDVSKSAAGRSIYLLGLAVYDALTALGVEIPALPLNSEKKRSRVLNLKRQQLEIPTLPVASTDTADADVRDVPGLDDPALIEKVLKHKARPSRRIQKEYQDDEGSIPDARKRAGAKSSTGGYS